jgi:hypothetical protein
LGTIILIFVGIAVISIALNNPILAIVILTLGGIGFEIGSIVGTGEAIYGAIMGVLIALAFIKK